MNEFASSLKEWKGIISEKNNHTCECCHNMAVKGIGTETNPSYKLSQHHIISKKLATGFGIPEFNLLVANGKLYCPNCHLKVHQEVGGYEFGGYLKAFSKFKGLENLGMIQDNSYYQITYNHYYLQKDRIRLLVILMMVLKNLKPKILEWLDPQLFKDCPMEEKIQVFLSSMFYVNVGKQLHHLDINKMTTWKTGQLETAVKDANIVWNNDIKRVSEVYNQWADFCKDCNFWATLRVMGEWNKRIKEKRKIII